MSHRKEMITGGVVIVFSIIAIVLANDIPGFKGLGAPPITAAFIPKLWAGVMFLLGVVLVIRGVRQRRALVRDGKTIPPMQFNVPAFVSDNREVILTFALLLLYIVFIRLVGFLIMTVIYVFCQTLILSPPEKRNYAAAAVTAVVSSVIIAFIFVKYLTIMLPKGILGF